MRTKQIEEVVPHGMYCTDNMSIIIDSKNQKSYRNPYTCPFLNKEFTKCWYATREISSFFKVCGINDESLIEIDETLLFND